MLTLYKQRHTTQGWEEKSLACSIALIALAGALYSNPIRSGNFLLSLFGTEHACVLALSTTRSVSSDALVMNRADQEGVDACGFIFCSSSSVRM